MTEQIALVDAVAAACASETFDVQYGPAAVQWCTRRIAARRRAKPRRAPAAASTCICSRRATSATGRTGISRRHRPLSRRHRLLSAAPDARALHLGAAGRARAARRARRHHLGQHLVEPASALRHRAACRDDQARLPRRARARRRDARRGRRRAARDAARRPAAWRHRLPRSMSTASDPRSRAGQRPPLGHQQGRRRHARAPARRPTSCCSTGTRSTPTGCAPDLDPLDLLFARSTARHIKELIVARQDRRARRPVTGIDCPR